ncbi:hypothetical protein GDO86_010945 [Hymenochirus boettgeri]|uniref:Uncharacterized protein n=1 Tax=Hymenochirus boettgeri TaxID=247094 RepID=A0A8T2JEA7_9PIPI|nr:hypothetical protein GDO86_010945 [Hymenochirus boettgeri]
MVLQEKANSIAGFDSFSSNVIPCKTFHCFTCIDICISIVCAVYAKVDLFRKILKPFMQVDIALLMQFAYLMSNNAYVNKDSVIASMNKFYCLWV